jgi:trehalose 6-phosphate synthase/phosphatase
MTPVKEVEDLDPQALNPGLGLSSVTPLLDRVKLLEQYRTAKKRLFLLDYDGTLTPIVNDPQAAIPSDRLLQELKSLTNNPDNEVWIISGRDQKFLDEWLGHISDLGFSAEHGSFIRYPRDGKWENVIADMDMSWRDEATKTFQRYTDQTKGNSFSRRSKWPELTTTGSWIETKKMALTWHYRLADPEHGASQARECKRELEQTVTKAYDVEVMTGKANLEVRPRFINKGEITRRLIAAGEDWGFVFCVGDDVTDEDMFRAIRQSNLPPEHGFSVAVGAGSRQTLANWHLLEPEDVISVLSLLNGHLDSGHTGAVAGSFRQPAECEKI